MKISKGALQILQNFGTINDTMILQKGKSQRVSLKGPYVAETELDDDIPQTCGIFSLKSFLAIVSLFDSPDFAFGPSYITITEGTQKVDFRLSDTNLPAFNQAVALDKKIKVASLDVEFIITKQNLLKLKKAANLLAAENVSIIGKDGKISLNSINLKDTQSSKYNFEIGDTDKEFNMIIPMTKLMMLDHDYRVQISKTRWIQFVSQNAKLLYGFTADSKSTFK